MSKDGQWPFYVPLATRGLLLGWLVFNEDADQALDIEGRLNWLKQAGPGKYYPNGFLVEALTAGCRWSAPGPGTNLLGFTNGVVILGGPTLAPPLTNAFSLKADNTVLGLWGNQLRLRFSPSSGAFSGSALDPATQTRIPLGGVLLQNFNSGYGCFLRTNQSGQVMVAP